MARKSFEDFMRDVDRAVSRKVGLSVYDLADIAFRDLYDDGLTAAQVATLALENEGWFE